MSENKNTDIDMGDIDSLLYTIDSLYALENAGELTEENIINLLASNEKKEEMYSKKDFSESQLSEISKGINANLSVEIYAKEEYNWKQMCELRQGLEEKIDVEIYAREYFSAEQMHEIRLGLLEHVDAASYAKLILSATDMKNKRKELVAKAYEKEPFGYERIVTDDIYDVKIKISDNLMEAYLCIPYDVSTEFTEVNIRKILEKNEILFGYIDKNICDIVNGKVHSEYILVAKGLSPVDGEDGWYESLFDEKKSRGPKILEDGRVDYSSITLSEPVEEGQVVMKYHKAKEGKDGSTVTGIPIHAQKGKELDELEGEGIIRTDDGSYVANTKGYVSYNVETSTINVSMIYIINGNANHYNGSINYIGDVHVMGDVNELTDIKATGDIVVNGFVSNATLSAGGNITIKAGVNCGSKGEIVAGKSIKASFFETTKVKAGGDVEAEYFLNSDIESDGYIRAKGFKSRIMGGKITALLGVEASIIGNYTGSRTIISVGDFEWINSRITRLFQKRTKVLNNIEKLEDGIVKLAKIFPDELLNTNPVYIKTNEMIKLQEIESNQYSKKMDELEKLKEKAMNAYVRASSELQQNVYVRICGESTEIENTIYGTLLNKAKLRETK